LGRTGMSATELDRIFRLENERTMGNDGVVRYRGRFYQLQGAAAPARPRIEPVRRSAEQRRAVRTAVRHTPAANHPWKQAARDGALRKALRTARLLPAATLTRPSASP